MGSKKVYLGSAILLLAAAAIGAGLWLQHRAEQKREERKNAIYGYWMTANLKGDFPFCIEIAKDRVVTTMLPGVPPINDEISPAIDEKGQVTAEVAMQNRNGFRQVVTFTLSPDDSLKLSDKTPGVSSHPSDIILKRITEKEYNDYWRPLDLTQWEKGKCFIDADYTCFIRIRAISQNRCHFSSTVKSAPQKEIHQKSDWSAYKGQIAIGSNEPKQFIRVYIPLGKNAIYGFEERKTFHLLTSEEYKANVEKIVEIHATGRNVSEQNLKKIKPILDSLFDDKTPAS